MARLPFTTTHQQIPTNIISLSEEKNNVIFSNHVSWEDLSILNNVLPKQIHFIVFNRKEIQKNEKQLLKSNRKLTFFPSVDANSIYKIIEMIENGEPVLLFPENKVSTTGNLMRIYPEISYIAFKSKALIHPLFIHNAETSNSSPSKLRFVNLLPSKPTVYVGESFELHTLTSNNGKSAKDYMAMFVFEKLSDLKFKTLNKTQVNLYNELLDSAKRHRENTYILKDTETTMTYKKLLLSIQIMAAKLKPFLAEEDRVGVLLPTSIGNILTLFSLFKLSISPAILNFTMGERGIQDCCETANLQIIITSRLFIEKAELESTIQTLSKNLKVVYLEDIKKTITNKDKLNGAANSLMSSKSTNSNNEIILFTSGSESKPKGVILTHDNIYANTQQALIRLDLKQDDLFLSTLPMFHSFGLTVCTFLPLLTGIPVFLHPSPIDYKTIPELVYQEEATLLLGTPTFLNGYAKSAHPYSLHSLRYVIAGAEKLKEDTREIWSEKFGIRILEGYGATEASPVVSLNTPLHYKRGTVGQLLPGMEYKIEPVEGIEKGGSLFIKGPNLMKGYLIHEKGFFPSTEWYNTGDVVEIDDNGFIQINSRLKRFAKIGGEMISLNLIEEEAAKCFGHDDLAAISVPDKRKGERVILYSTNHENTLKTFKKHIKTNKVSTLVLPSKIEYIDVVPLLGSGKTDYVSLEKVNEIQKSPLLQ